MTIKELKRKELPALDDEFAKDVSEFDTLEELKKATNSFAILSSQPEKVSSFSTTI